MGSALDLVLGGVIFRASGSSGSTEESSGSEIPSCTVPSDEELCASLSKWCDGTKSDDDDDADDADDDVSSGIVPTGGTGGGGSSQAAAMAASQSAGIRLISSDRTSWDLDAMDDADADAGADAGSNASGCWHGHRLGPEFESGLCSGYIPEAWRQCRDTARATAVGLGGKRDTAVTPADAADDEKYAEEPLLPLVVATVESLPRAALVESELVFATASSVHDPEWLEDEDVASRRRGVGVSFRSQGKGGEVVGEGGATEAEARWCVVGRGVRRGAAVVVIGLDFNVLGNVLRAGNESSAPSAGLVRLSEALG